jgi:predicted site-specific integrase-resolvase
MSNRLFFYSSFEGKALRKAQKSLLFHCPYVRVCQKPETDILGARIIVINGDKLSPAKEMVEDLLAIVTVFSARFHGLRSYRKVLKDACQQENQT